MYAICGQLAARWEEEAESIPTLVRGIGEKTRMKGLFILKYNAELK